MDGQFFEDYVILLDIYMSEYKNSKYVARKEKKMK